MDADFNASFDVEVLSAAFNMDKADFMGKLKLIDDFTTFDNDRFDVIRANCDMLEEVTDAELTLRADVQAILVDREWFQVYDNLAQFDEKYVASGMYWNYFYHIWKTVSSSPFSNAIVFVDDGATTTAPADVDVYVESIVDAGGAKIYTLRVDDTTGTLQDMNVEFIQDEDAVVAGIAVHKYGAVIMPTDSTASNFENTYTLIAKIGEATYTADDPIVLADAGEDETAVTATAVGDKITLSIDT